MQLHAVYAPHGPQTLQHRISIALIDLLQGAYSIGALALGHLAEIFPPHSPHTAAKLPAQTARGAPSGGQHILGGAQVHSCADQLIGR